MQIDWVTVGAQIINFMILVWLLRHFLYGPISKAMAEREERIVERLRSAEAARLEAHAEAANYQDQQRALENGRAAFIEVAREEADTVRRTLEDDARREVGDIRADWIQTIEEEKLAFQRDIRQGMMRGFIELARHGLGDLAGADLEERMAGRFVQALQDLTTDQCTELETGMSRLGRHATVRSYFPLSKVASKTIEEAIRNVFGDDVSIQFSQRPEVICGIELRAGGRLVRWTLDAYLDRLSADLEAQVEARVLPHVSMVKHQPGWQNA